MSSRRTVLDSVIDSVLARYVEPLEVEQVLAPAIQRMVGDLDPHSYYLTAKQRDRARAMAQGHATTGLLVRFESRGGSPPHLEVVGVEPGSDPWNAGVRPGDHVIRIGNRAAESFLNQADVEMTLAGLPGERRHLWVELQGGTEPRSVDVQLRRRDAAGAVDATVRRVDGRRYLHLKISSFVVGVGERVRRLVHDRRLEGGTHGLDGIVLDLRGNPGGAVDEALIVADLFVGSGVLTRTRGRQGKILREELAHRAGTDDATPLAVLQDRNTGSASELLAAALQDHHRAIVVGEQSYGKGTVQDVIGMPDGSVLTLTIARYYSPLDRGIDGVGVRPDVWSNSGSPVISTADDRALDQALVALQAGTHNADN